MNKTELVNAVAERTDLLRRDAEAAVTAVFDSISEALCKDEKVQIIGFGTFETKLRAARVGRNPQTMETIEIPETRMPTFKPGKTLKDAVDRA